MMLDDPDDHGEHDADQHDDDDADADADDHDDDDDADDGAQYNLRTQYSLDGATMK
jgi:hypothetical protein